MKIFTHKGWLKEGRMRFGDNTENWKFTCPLCGRKQSIMDFKKQGIRYGFAHVYFCCISRFTNAAICDFTCAHKTTVSRGWQLPRVIRLHKTEVITREGTVPVFQFADAEKIETPTKWIATTEQFFGRRTGKKRCPLFQSEALTATAVPNLRGGWSVKDGRGAEFGNFATKVDAERMMKMNGW